MAARLEKIRSEPEEEDSIDTETIAVGLNKQCKSKSELPDTPHNDEESIKEQEVIQEDDMFDIYKDHEIDEFGHKKYQPENIYVKIKKDEVPSDFLAECLKLKGDILKLKSEPEPSIESLVEAFDNTHVNDAKPEASASENAGNDCKVETGTDTSRSCLVEVLNTHVDETKPKPSSSENGVSECKDQIKDERVNNNSSSVHIHKHLLATIGQHG